MQQHQQQNPDSVPLDILLAQLKNPLIVREDHQQLLKQKHHQMPEIINNNYELLADKYLLLSNALPGCSPELIVEEFEKVVQVVEKCCNQFIEKMKKVIKDLQAFANYDTQVLKGYLTQATDVFQRCFYLAEKDFTSFDVDFLMENFTNPENSIQNHLLTLIFERNQNLQNVMSKVYTEQLDFAASFRAQFEQLCNTNHFEPLNKLLNNQKQFWSNRVKKQIQTQKQLMEEQQAQQVLVQSIIQFAPQIQQFQQQQQYQQQQQQQQSQIVQSQIQQQPPQDQSWLTKSQMISIEAGNQQLIETMLKLRAHTHELMQQHDKESKKDPKRHCKLEGGGSFGYCWTGGYGWKGTIYEGLELSNQCPQCQVLNKDMHNTAKKLYDLEYRDKGTWWVRAWFLYKR
ncbi:unnamed protein product (macronuclear) [Paramecium tetraurelia]|uniref:Uncharacterized protein n=1 Tax=Paramecium tetraurelia TaxID=5888 RepID=A0E7C1_PARTE|nr:uncharacterized protein GSPATT00023916001 [Paramecium tetraurelia]CAK91188.1 unnamed protein product [Paramecium tetraurelia]|eukprot:XP_001458585.1 hypothetical protein (macronuclear) [Paramecium tetraurelia strain d4-2]